MKDEHSLSWQTYEVVSPTTLRIPFVGNGDSRCYGFRATVEETPKEVRIRLLSGTLPKAPRACTLPALHSTLLVQLKAPLSDRVVYAVE
ncbi:hypothetical protein KIMH_01530 [Bombiscardovia apis]|uniref:Uncharacterized protein n=2 Tax=Bombiscardovia apis TaxID=2932182 RepID=A0ABM8BAV4_9BIFI|nr:hypothetical protein KIMH_01530 [Bombiscardovia apis]